MTKYEFTFNYKGANFGIYLADNHEYENQLMTPGTIKTFCIKAASINGQFVSRDYTKLRNRKSEIVHIFDDLAKREGTFAVIASIKDTQVNYSIIQDLFNQEKSDQFFDQVYEELRTLKNNASHEQEVTLCEV